MSEPATVTVSNYYPSTLVEIDTDEGTRAIPVRSRRLTQAEIGRFNLRWGKINDRESAKAIHRMPDGPEMETKPVTLTVNGQTLTRDVFVIDDDEIRRRRLSEMTQAARATWEALEEAEALEGIEIAADTVRAFLDVAPRMPGPGGAPFRLNYENAAGETRQARTGADLVEMFGGNLQILGRLAAVVVSENTLGPEKKTRSRRPSDSNIGSTPTPLAVGSSPAAIADAAAPPASVDLASAAP